MRRLRVSREPRTENLEKKSESNTYSRPKSIQELVSPIYVRVDAVRRVMAVDRVLERHKRKAGGAWNIRTM